MEPAAAGDGWTWLSDLTDWVNSPLADVATWLVAWVALLAYAWAAAVPTLVVGVLLLVRFVTRATAAVVAVTASAAAATAGLAADYAW